MKSLKLHSLLFVLLLILSASIQLLADVKVRYLPDNSPIKLRLLQEVAGGKNKVDEVVSFEVYESICDPDGYILVPAGAKATGHILKSSKPKTFGKNGSLEISIDSLTAIDGKTIPLSAVGKGKAPDIRALTMLVAPIGGIFSKGISMVFKEGKLFEAYTVSDDQEIPVASDTKLDSTKKMDIAILSSKTKKDGSIAEIILRNNSNTVTKLYLIVKAMKNEEVKGDGSILVDNLLPGEERICQVPFNSWASRKGQLKNLVVETYPAE